MDNEVRNDTDVFFQMARDFPVRTGIFTFGLPAFALFQMINGIVYEGSLLFIGVFSALVVAYSIQLTRYHVAIYRREKFTREWVRDR